MARELRFLPPLKFASVSVNIIANMATPIPFSWSFPQSTYTVYKKYYHSLCPLVGIGTLPPPLSPASVPPSPRNQRWDGAHSPAGEGLGES
jgi:hypothetical protein